MKETVGVVPWLANACGRRSERRTCHASRMLVESIAGIHGACHEVNRRLSPNDLVVGVAEASFRHWIHPLRASLRLCVSAHRPNVSLRLGMMGGCGCGAIMVGNIVAWSLLDEGSMFPSRRRVQERRRVRIRCEDRRGLRQLTSHAAWECGRAFMWCGMQLGGKGMPCCELIRPFRPI